MAVLIFSGRLPIGGVSQSIVGDVLMWGVFPDSEMSNIIQPFNAKAKTYRINYIYVGPNDFERKLVEALASGIGPDVILAPYQIILSQQRRIYPFPASNFSETAYKNAYIDGASIFWTPYGALALPVAAEPMVLFFNRTLFSKHGLSTPPKYWDEVTRMVPDLTVINANGNLLESGIALGTYNVPYIKDIVMTIVSQFGQLPVLTQFNNDGSVSFDITADTPITETSPVLPLTSIMRFVTEFSDPLKVTYTWNHLNGDASDVFVAEKLAMYIGYAGELPVLRNRNPKMNIDMTYIPQTKDYGTFSTGLRLYGIATMRQSKNPAGSLAVEAAFAGAEYSPQIAQVVGAQPALREYLDTPGLNEVLKNSLLVARGWYDVNAISTADYMSQMFLGITSGKQGVTDAVDDFVSRMYDLYTKR